MALQAKCEDCKIRFVWGGVDSDGALDYTGKQIPLRDCNCRVCGGPLQATTHLSSLKVRKGKPWSRVKAISEVSIRKAMGGR